MNEASRERDDRLAQECAARQAAEAPAAERVRGDRHRLRRVLQNVIGNAVKYSRCGRPIQVVVAEEGPWVGVTVQDQGVGIPADEVPQVFTPFFRAATAQGIAGTGLDLGGRRPLSRSTAARSTSPARSAEARP